MIILALKITAIWLVLSFLIALAIGRMIRARDELQLTEADMLDPRVTDLLFPRQGGSCSRGGESPGGVRETLQERAGYAADLRAAIREAQALVCQIERELAA